MAVLLDNGSVFFRVPKTASSWVKQVLIDLDIVADYELVRKHTTPYQWFRRGHPMATTGKLSDADERPFCFTFVRRPSSWLESMWKYEKSHNFERDQRGLRPHQWQRFQAKGWHPLRALNDCLTNPFEAFVENVLNKRPGFVSEMYGWYTNPYWIDFVGHQETSVDSLTEALTQAGYDVSEEDIQDVKPRRVSPDYDLSWSGELLPWVELTEASAYVRYGYDFKTINFTEPDNA